MNATTPRRQERRRGIDGIFRSASALPWRLGVLAFILFSPTEMRADDMTLWYAQPAKVWMTEALPIGNGRIGGMVFGGVDQEHIQFNEDTLWSGAPSSPPKGGAEHLKQIQDLLTAGDEKQVEPLMKKYFSSSAKGAYQPFGNLLIDVHPSGASFSDYRRELNLRTGVAAVHYSLNGVAFDREYFCSFPDQVMVLQFSSSKPKGISFTLRMTTPHDGSTVAAKDNRLILDGRLAANKLGFQAIAVAEPEGGSLEATGDHIDVREADAVTIVLAAATEFGKNDAHGANESRYHGRLGQR